MEKNRTGRQKKSSNFIIQGTILAVAGIVVRLIGMLYRIPLTNRIGDEGIGYYSAAFSVYSILLIVSSYSLPVALSKMIATKIARKEYRNSLRVFRAAMFYATVVGGAGAAILWFGADYFAASLLHMPFTVYALKTLVPTVWIMAYLGVLRGYFQGMGTMIPTAVSQIFEQIINAVVSVMAASYLFGEGMKANLVRGSSEYSFAFGASGGTIGTGVGAAVALLLLALLIMGYRPVMRRQARRDQTRGKESYGEISGVLFVTVLPIIVSSTIYNIGAVVDNGIYGYAMVAMGKEGEIAATWGVYMGKYHLLFNIPVAIANSLASSVIPALSRAVANKSRRQIIEKVSLVIRFSMIIAIPATVGLTVLAGPVNNLLFRGTDNTELIRMTMAGSLAVAFFSLSTVTNAVLQGINRMQTPIRNAAIALILHVGILLAMLFVFKMGIYSVVYSNILFALFVCVLNGLSIGRYLRYRQEIKKTFLLPAVASGIMGAAAYGVYRLVFQFAKSSTLGTLLAVAVAVLLYGALLLRLGCVDAEELKSMPGGTRILGAARRLHLMQ